MKRNRLLPMFVAIALAATAAACKRAEEKGGTSDRDTLSIHVPESVDERVEEGARRVGGRVGEAIEETGQAIEEAGERIKEEAGETVRDTL